MGAKSRNKGKAGERELAGELRDITGWNVQRRVRQHEGDSDLDGLPGWSAESKRHATATRGEIAGWWHQAVDQAGRVGARPVLFYRRDRDSWRAVWPLSVHLSPGVEWIDYELTIEGSLRAWCASARELEATAQVQTSVNT